jgi:PAS domain S-box-containing protein
MDDFDDMRASEARLRALIDTGPGFVWRTGADGGVDFLNQRWYDYTGMTPAEAHGFGWARAVHPDDADGLSRYWIGLLQSNQPGQYEARLRRFDGAYRWFLIRATPKLDQAGRVLHWFGGNTDIDDHKRGELLLAGEKRVLEMMATGRALAEILGELCTVVEGALGGCASGIVLAPSRRGQAVTEAACISNTLPDALIARGMRSVLDPQACPLAAAALAGDQVIVDDLSAESRWPDWATVVRANGFCAAIATPVASSQGAVLGVLIILYRQIHAPTGHENALIAQFSHMASIAIERAFNDVALNQIRSDMAHVARVATLGALTASIAHEVNQPLSGIITNASTCQRMLGATPPNIDGALETAQRIVRDGYRAADVIKRLRALFSKKPVAAECVDLNATTREVVTLLLGELQRHGISVLPAYGNELPQVTGDRVQLQQVILNLVLNASDALQSTTDRPRQIWLRTWADQRAVHLAVEDNGTGFDAADAAQLFDAFYTTKDAGMGIGLSVSRSIMESLDGQLHASLNEQHGATFTLTLPLATTHL